MNSFDVSEDSYNVIVERIKNKYSSKDEAGRYSLRYLIEFLSFGNIACSNFVTNA
jgi:hypothetical protein